MLKRFRGHAFQGRELHVREPPLPGFHAEQNPGGTRRARGRPQTGYPVPGVRDVRSQPGDAHAQVCVPGLTCLCLHPQVAIQGFLVFAVVASPCVVPVVVRVAVIQRQPVRCRVVRQRRVITPRVSGVSISASHPATQIATAVSAPPRGRRAQRRVTFRLRAFGIRIFRPSQRPPPRQFVFLLPFLAHHESLLTFRNLRGRGVGLLQLANPEVVFVSGARFTALLKMTSAVFERGFVRTFRVGRVVA